MAWAICLILAGLLCPCVAATAESRLQVRSVVRADSKSGRLVRASIVKRAPAAPPSAPADSASPTAQPAADRPTDLGSIVNAAAASHGVDPVLVHSVIAVESGYNPLAVSPKGAQGLMQLIPATARRFGVTDSFDMRQNIEAGVKYLRYLQETFKDDRLALAAYNAGEGSVLKYGGIPPYRETEEYVKKVGRKLEAVRRDAPPRTEPAAAVESNTAEVSRNAAPPLRTLEFYTDEAGRLHFVTRDVSERKSPPAP